MPPNLRTWAPETRGIVKFKEPPDSNRDDDDNQQLLFVRSKKRMPFDSWNNRVDKNNVTSPNNRRETETNKSISWEQENLGGKYD